MKMGAGLVGRANPTALFIGAVVAVSTIAIAVGLAIFATRGDGGNDGKQAANASSNSSTSTTSTSSSTTTTTTVAPGLLTTTTTVAGANTNGGAQGSGGQAPELAYSDPDDPVFEGLPLPAGIGATLTPGSCVWNAANGGELRASGTISASPTTDDAWFVTVYWLQNDRELDDQFEVYELEPGETKAWELSTSAPLPPAEPFRCALEVE
jgi:hypothetical protein